MIDFSLSKRVQQTKDMLLAVAGGMIRPISREFDEREHEVPWDLLRFMWQQQLQQRHAKGRLGQQAPKTVAESAEQAASGADSEVKQAKVSENAVQTAVMIESLSWGDAGIYLSIPNEGLGGAAIRAAGSPEQIEHFLGSFYEGEPKWGAMAITEPHCGSDTKAIRTTASRDGDFWVLNGTKIFCTSGNLAATQEGSFIVVWATVDKSAGRAGIKSFVVPANTPGMTIAKLEEKHGIRASQTAMLVFENCRIPANHLLGSDSVEEQRKGFKGAMATFDASRPFVAASAIGIGQAALDFLREVLKKEGIIIRYETPLYQLSALELKVQEIEAEIEAARLLTWRAAWLIDQKTPNSLEASMAKLKAGIAVTRATQTVVELLGSMGYSTEHLAEKWMRDAKINDIYEGTKQINTLVVARRILGYTSKELS